MDSSQYSHLEQPQKVHPSLKWEFLDVFLFYPFIYFYLISLIEDSNSQNVHLYFSSSDGLIINVFRGSRWLLMVILLIVGVVRMLGLIDKVLSKT